MPCNALRSPYEQQYLESKSDNRLNILTAARLP